MPDVLSSSEIMAIEAFPEESIQKIDLGKSGIREKVWCLKRGRFVTPEFAATGKPERVHHGCGRRACPRRDAEIRALYRQGLTLREIGDRVGLTTGGIQGAIRRLGLPRRGYRKRGSNGA